MAKLEIPEDWEAAAETILDAEWRKVFLLGAADVGKSRFCRFLSERLLAAGHGVALVDADIGQKDIGPPAAVTLGYPRLGTPLSDTPVAPDAIRVVQFGDLYVLPEGRELGRAPRDRF